MKTVLNGHTTADTAYVVDDYPYGFTLRCKMRWWVETKRGFGMRIVTQTTNPKRPGEVWNKPKAGTYCSLVVMYRDETDGHVHSDGLHIHSGPEQFTRFKAEYYAQLATPHRELYDRMEAYSRKTSPRCWTEFDGKHSQVPVPGQVVGHHRVIAVDDGQSVSVAK